MGYGTLQNIALLLFVDLSSLKLNLELKLPLFPPIRSTNDNHKIATPHLGEVGGVGKGSSKCLSGHDYGPLDSGLYDVTQCRLRPW